MKRIKRDTLRRRNDVSDTTIHLILQLVTILASMAGFMNSDFGRTVAKGVGNVARKLGESPEMIRAIPGLISSLKTYGAKREEVDKALRKAEQIKASMERDKKLREAKETANKTLKSVHEMSLNEQIANSRAKNFNVAMERMRAMRAEAKMRAMKAGMKSMDKACEDIIRVMRIADGVSDMVKSIRRYARVIR